jgi:hypothetical protein
MEAPKSTRFLLARSRIGLCCVSLGVLMARGNAASYGVPLIHSELHSPTAFWRPERAKSAPPTRYDLNYARLFSFFRVPISAINLGPGENPPALALSVRAHKYRPLRDRRHHDCGMRFAHDGRAASGRSR